MSKQERIEVLKDFLNKTDYEVYKALESDIKDPNYLLLEELRQKMREYISAIK